MAYVPTIGHTVALAYASSDPKRVKGLIETAHALLAAVEGASFTALANAPAPETRAALETLDGARWAQFCRETPELLDARVSAAAADLVFARARAA